MVETQGGRRQKHCTPMRFSLTHQGVPEPQDAHPPRRSSSYITVPSTTSSTFLPYHLEAYRIKAAAAGPSLPSRAVFGWPLAALPSYPRGHIHPGPDPGPGLANIPGIVFPLWWCQFEKTGVSMSLPSTGVIPLGPSSPRKQMSFSSRGGSGTLRCQFCLGRAFTSLDRGGKHRDHSNWARMPPYPSSTSHQMRRLCHARGPDPQFPPKPRHQAGLQISA